MSNRYVIEALLRPAVELNTAVVSGMAAYVCVQAPWAVALAPSVSYVTAAGFAALAVTRTHQGMKIIRYRRNLRRLPRYVMSTKQIPVSHRRLFLGQGFRWTQKHTQRLQDTLRPEVARYLQPNRFYQGARQLEMLTEHRMPWLGKLLSADTPLNPVRPLPPVGGNPALHGIEPDEKDVTASGDWTLSCVRGQVTSVTFVFSDGTVRTLPRPDTSNNAGGQNNNAQAKQDTGTGGGIGWISDENGIPCIGGERKSNAFTYLPTIFGLSAAGAAGEAMSQGQYTTQNNVNGISATMTGDAGQAALGKAISGGMSETTDWIKQRYGMTFDAIYVPPGARLAVHITRQLAIDYEDKGRKVRYDFTLPGGVSDNGGLD